MKSQQIISVVILFLCLNTGGLAYQKGSDEICVLPKNCPSIWSLTQRDFDQRKCGFEGRYIKIWCSVKCTTPSSEPGICKPAEECKSFLTMVDNSNLNNIESTDYLRKFICNNIPANPDPYVCCTSANQQLQVETTSVSTTTSQTTRWTTSKPTRRPPLRKDQCGVETGGYRIIEGDDAHVGQHPWVAILQYYDSRGVQTSAKCGGTLISRRYVLTAAHCKNDRFGKLSKVVLGEHDLRTPIDCVGKSCAPPPQVIEIETILRHPDWVNAQRQFFDDIALLRLARDAQFTDFVKPICLPKRNQKPKYAEDLTIAGWGRTENDVSSDVKKIATIHRQFTQDCLKTIKIPLGNSQLCVGGGRKDSCSGDSGGPLMLPKEDTTGITTWYLVGIVSFGYNAPCGTIGKPGIYTAVGDYVDWIYKNMY